MLAMEERIGDARAILPGGPVSLASIRIWVVKQDAPFTAHYYYWVRKMANPGNMLGLSSPSLEQNVMSRVHSIRLADPLFKRIGRQRG